MSKQNIGQKAERVLKLLLGIRNPRAASALVAYGFREHDLQEGWQRLAALTRIRLGARAPIKDQRVIDAMHEFENTWFPIARATLERRYPDVASTLYLNLSQTSRADVAVSVGTFLERLKQMDEGEGGFAANGAAARKILEERGLTAELEKEARAMVDMLASFDAAPALHPSPEEEQAAESALWSWYLEWARIARVAIRDKRLLRSLGFRQGKKGSADVIDVPGDVVSPVPSPVPPVVAQTPALPPVAQSPSEDPAPNGFPPAPQVPALPPPSVTAPA